MNRKIQVILALALGTAATCGASESGGGTTYYFKPHAPTNAVVWVRYEGEKLYPDMDHKYWVDNYWTNGITVAISYSTDNGYLFADGSSETNFVLRITENKSEIYPPEGFESAYLAQAQSGSTYYQTLKEAIDTAKSRARIELMDSVTLEETLTVTNSITLDLNTNTVTLGRALTNAFHFTAGATVSNGTINSSLLANIEGSALLRFTDCKATLKDLTINGSGYERVVALDSNKTPAEKYAAKRVSNALTCDGLILTGNGCLISIDFANATLTNGCSVAVDNAFASFGGKSEAAVSCTGNGTVTIADGAYSSPNVLQSGDLGGGIVVNGGTFNGRICSWMSTTAHADLERYSDYKARFTFNGGIYTDASIAFAYADSFDLSTFTKGDGVVIAPASGYAWDGTALVRESIEAGVTSETYSDALAATNAAAAINKSKEDSVSVPVGVEDSAAYCDMLEATVTSDNRVVIDLTPEAMSNEQVIVDAAVTSETAVVALIGTNLSAKATIEPTTPGLYYWIVGGVDVCAVTNSGAGVLSTDGGAVELSRPELDAAKGKAFFKIAVGVRAPAQPTLD